MGGLDYKVNTTTGNGRGLDYKANNHRSCDGGLDYKVGHLVMCWGLNHKVMCWERVYFHESKIRQDN